MTHAHGSRFCTKALRRLLALGLICFLALPVIARAEEPTLQQRLDRLCEQLEQRRTSLNIPGFGLAIVKDDQVILSRGFGVRDVEQNLPVTDETLFAIGSSSKAFTAALCAIMVDEEKMAWDDLLRKHLPQFKMHDPEANEKLTVADSLSHRSGLMRTDIVWASGEATSEEILAAIARAEPTETFREKFQYQNVMYLGAGLASANAAGMNGDWNGLVTKRLLQPLGMINSNTTIAEAQQNPQLSLGYMWDEDKKKYKRLPMRPLNAIAPAGAINSNVRDMAQWVRLQLNRGEIDGKRIINADRFEEMWKEHISMSDSTEGSGMDAGYGLGWMVHDWRGKRVVEHGGNIDGFGAEVAMLPDDRIGFVLLTNVTATPLQQMSIDLIFDALLGEWSDDPAPTLDPTTVEEYLGKYRFEMMNADVTVLMKDGKLAVDVPGQMVYTLKPPDEEGKWKFELTDTIAIGFVRDDSGNVIAMNFFQAGMTMECPKEGVILPVEIAADEAQKYLGVYHDESLELDITVFHRNGRLAVDVPGQTVFELHMPNEEGKWVFRLTDSIAVRFNADETGAIKSITHFQNGEERDLPRVDGNTGKAVPTLDELLALHASASGSGRAKAMGPVRIVAKFDMPNQGVFDSKFEIVSAEPHRFIQHIDMGKFGWMKIAADGESGWTSSTFSPSNTLPKEAALATRFAHPLLPVFDWSKTFEGVDIARLDTINEREVVVVELNAGKDLRCMAFVDRETGQTLKLDYVTIIPGITSVRTTALLKDWRETNGIMAPHRFEIEDMLYGKTIIEIRDIQPLDAMPPDAMTQPATDS